jgi:signal transduction histidine kinase/DNA-binding NtrC family response regulator
MNEGASILLVEDVKISADAMKHVLEGNGYFVSIASSGSDARTLLAASSNQFDFLVTDLNLGDGPCGWDVAREARAKSANIPVIYVTGACPDKWRNSGTAKSLMMQKPLTATNLVKALATFADRLAGNHADCIPENVEDLQFQLCQAEDCIRRLTAAATEAASRQAVAACSDADALALSRTETTTGRADLLASETALALSQAETKVGLVDLLASAAALATARAETKISLADLVTSAAALAVSRTETETGQSDLLASELANQSLVIANSLLVTNEAALEQIVERRTAELTRELEERRIAEEALHQGEKLRALGQLTGGIAHDFNNILQIVFSTTAFLRSPDIQDGRRLRLLDDLENAAALAGQVTNRLLAFARKKVMVSQSCNINSVLEGMDELLLPNLGPKVLLEKVLAPEVWPIIVDQSQLEVTILNLASNARDAMLPDGGVFQLVTSNVVLPATLDHAAGEHVCLTISDTGSGMPAHVAAHAFEPFFTTKPQGKGTGLGLAQVWGFAKQSGGDVTVSTAKEGTSFSIHFPRATDVALRENNAQTAAEDKIKISAQTVPQKTVLVVEDNTDLSSLTVSLLRQVGYDTLSAENAREALKIIEGNGSIDAVFSDIVMPGDMNGVELAQILYRRYPRLPVTLATGYSEFLISHPAPPSVEVLSKPYRIGELTSAIGRSLRDNDISARSIGEPCQGDIQGVTSPVHNEASDAVALGAAVHILGPADVDVTLTPTAALETARRVGDAAIEVLIKKANSAPTTGE